MSKQYKVIETRPGLGIYASGLTKREAERVASEARDRYPKAVFVVLSGH